jgi:hypothetical protein
MKFIVILKITLHYIGFVKITIIGAKKEKSIPKIKYTIFCKKKILYMI